MTTSRSILSAMKKAETARGQGYYLEAFFTAYHANLNLMRLLLKNTAALKAGRHKKVKAVYKDFFRTHRNNQKLKSLVTAQSAKLVRTWLDKTDPFFKSLKNSAPTNTKLLLDEATKITGVLNIAATKLAAKKPRSRA